MPEESTPRVYSLCIVVLAVEWVLFGSLHFTFHNATKAEILSCIPFKTFIVGVTGMVEVTTGILILLPKTRKWAALTALVLLALFLPSIYKMLVVDTAIPGTVAWRNFVRVLLVPNHVFMALCAIHLWQSPTLNIGPARALEDFLNNRRSPAAAQARAKGHKLGTPLIASVLLAANIAGFLEIYVYSKNQSAASTYLWAMMCLASGALVGFLFGVPRINPETTKLKALLPNSNIEVVSDWLTKIIVGVGLVEIRGIGQFIRKTSFELGQALAPPMASQTEIAARAAFATGVIVYFFVAGMIQGYLLTRMYLREQFQEVEEQGGST